MTGVAIHKLSSYIGNQLGARAVRVRLADFPHLNCARMLVLLTEVNTSGR